MRFETHFTKSVTIGQMPEKPKKMVEKFGQKSCLLLCRTYTLTHYFCLFDPKLYNSLILIIFEFVSIDYRHNLLKFGEDTTRNEQFNGSQLRGTVYGGPKHKKSETIRPKNSKCRKYG